MELKELEEIISLFSKNNLTHLEVAEDGTRICLKKEGSIPVPTVVQELPTTMELSGTPVKAPMVGVFYTASSPDSDPFVTVGSKVEKGDVIGLIEAMKMMNEIIAPASGVIQSILVENEALVSYDDSLFIIEERTYVS